MMLPGRSNNEPSVGRGSEQTCVVLKNPVPVWKSIVGGGHICASIVFYVIVGERQTRGLKQHLNWT